MATKIGDLFYKITGDSKGLDNSLKKSNTEVTGFGKKLGNIGSIIKGALFTGALIAGARKVVDFSRQIITAASDAEETSNKFTVVFSTVADDAKAAADRIKDEFKLSDETVEKFLSGVGDITSGLGATSTEALSAAEQITSLGLDINSFANLSGGAEQAVSALTSLFTGEREAAKALGIVINDTNLKAYAEDMGKVFKELTPLEKGFLSLELATKQSQLAIGDFARSSDSYANTAKAAEEATKDFKAALGESLLPAATEALSIFSELTTGLTEYIDEHNELRDIVDRFDAGTQTLRDEEKIAQNQLKITRDKIAALEEEIEKTESFHFVRIKQLKEEQEAENEKAIQIQQTIAYIRSLATEEEREAAILKEAADKQTALFKIQLEAEDELETRRRKALSDGDKAIDNIDKQIEKWVQFREVEGVQTLINDLVAERTKLIKEQTDEIDENLRKEKEASEQKKEDRIEEFFSMAETIEEEKAASEKLREDEATADKEASDARIKLEKDTLKEKKDAWVQYSTQVLGLASSLFDSLSTLQLATAKNQIDLIDQQTQALLISLGLADETTIESLERRRNEAIESDDTEKAALLQREIQDEKERAIIIKDAENKKAKIQYDAELSAWKLKKLSTIASGAQAIIQGYAQLGPIGGTIAAVGTAIVTGIQLGIINESKPQLQSFANGGIVQGRPSQTDNTIANVASGELVANQGQKDRMLMEFLNGGGSAGGNVIHNVVNLDGKAIIDFMTKSSKNRTFITSAGSVK